MSYKLHCKCFSTSSANFSTNGAYVVLNFCKFSDTMVLIFWKNFNSTSPWISQFFSNSARQVPFFKHIYFHPNCKFANFLKDIHIPNCQKHQKCLHKTCSCPLVWYFGTLFWDDITLFWDENLLLFTFLTGKLRKKNSFGPIKSLFTYYHNKFLSQNIVISSQNNVQKYHPVDMKRFIEMRLQKQFGPNCEVPPLPR